MKNTINPYLLLVDSIIKATEYVMPVKVYPLTEDGDVRFSVPFKALGWSASSLDTLTFCLPLIGSLVGTILVNSHPKCFDSVILSNNYTACSKFKHLGFGLKSRGLDLMFYCHCSLLLHLFNLCMATELKQAQKEIVNVPVSKKTQSDNAVTIRSFGDDKSYTVIVSKGSSLEHSIELAITNLMEHFGLTKSINVTLGQFQLECEAKDK